MEVYNHLQIREIFHLEFLRWLAKKVKMQFYVLKGGCNLRFFFKNIRYSEDMDVDIQGISVETLKEKVWGILTSPLFKENLDSFGIKEVIPPNITKSKQTQTTQRFKIHLITSDNQDLFTKIEFSRRGFKGNILIEPVDECILRIYRIPPVIVPHYDISSTIIQKIEAILYRRILQPRDIFDLYILSTQFKTSQKNIKIKRLKFKEEIQDQ